MEEIKKCLLAGEIPKAYEGVIEKIEVVEKRHLIHDEELEKAESALSIKSVEEMKARAMEGYFVRDSERNLVYCPCGEILRQKSEKRMGRLDIRTKQPAGDA